MTILSSTSKCLYWSCACDPICWGDPGILVCHAYPAFTTSRKKSMDRLDDGR